MIQLLNHRDQAIAQQIWSVFQASYAVEAELLGADEFPPLKRTVPEFMESDTFFYGFRRRNDLASVMEIEPSSSHSQICSLVVHPAYFRQGIASQMVGYALAESKHNTILVETGADNLPAIQLYEKFGFQLVRRWMTEIGIVKVGFRLDRANPQTP